VLGVALARSLAPSSPLPLSPNKKRTGRDTPHARPSAALDGTNTYGTFLSSASRGRWSRISIGSVSAAMTTNSEMPRLSVLVAVVCFVEREGGRVGVSAYIHARWGGRDPPALARGAGGLGRARRAAREREFSLSLGRRLAAAGARSRISLLPLLLPSFAPLRSCL